jgi:hypothetical protein
MLERGVGKGSAEVVAGAGFLVEEAEEGVGELGGGNGVMRSIVRCVLCW